MSTWLTRAWHAVKASGQRPNYAARYVTRVPGEGIVPVPPMAQMDYARLVGEVRDNGVTAICLKWLRRNVTQGQLRIGYHDEESGEYEPLDGAHPAYDLLRRPNPLWSWKEIVGGVVDEVSLDGNGYWVKARDGDGQGQVRELYWIPNRFAQVEPNHDESPARPVQQFWIRNAGALFEPWRPEDVIHFRDGTDPMFPWMGWSTLKRQLRSLAGLNAGESYTASVLRHGHAGKVLVPREPTMAARGSDPSPDEIELRSERDRIGRQVTGENAGKIGIASLPLDALELGSGPESMLIDRILDRPEAMIVAAFNLNSLVLDLPSSASTRTYANKAEARRDAWHTAVIPLQDLIADFLTTQLLFWTNEQGELVPEWGDDLDVRFYWDRSKVDALREDANERVQRVTSLFQATVLPRNRCLAEGNFDPVDGPDGELYYGEQTETSKQQADEAMQRQQEMETPAEGEALEKGRTEEELAAEVTPNEEPADG